MIERVPTDPTVYAFMFLGAGVELPELAPFKTTRRRIETDFGGVVLEGTAEVVGPDDLDAHGRYFRRPTGWGDLPA